MHSECRRRCGALNQQDAYPDTRLAWPKSCPAHGSFIRCRQLLARLVFAVPRLELGSTDRALNLSHKRTCSARLPKLHRLAPGETHSQSSQVAAMAR